MATPIRNKFKLWRSTNRGIKSRFRDEIEQPVVRRDDVPDLSVESKIERGDVAQKLRLKYYPSIDVDKQMLFAGSIKGSLARATDRLIDLGFRNNPTAYVEVTDENGPDDGSYSKQFVTEDGGRFDIPKVINQPSYRKRLKEQYHVTVYDVGSEVHFLSHKEVSAWLQPARHVWQGDVSARIGVRDFREMWFDEFQSELGGKSNIMWESVR